MAQLFDGVDSLAETVSDFLREGFLVGDAALVVVIPPHWDAIAARFPDRPSLERVLQSGQLTVRDAADTLKLFMRQGAPDRQLFDRSVGALVERLASRGTCLRIYGEMVDLLAEEGAFVGARQLEEVWNELAARASFSLLCGYAAVNFGNPRSASDLQLICQSHDRVRSNPRDILSSFLVGHDAARDPLRVAR